MQPIASFVECKTVTKPKPLV